MSRTPLIDRLRLKITTDGPLITARPDLGPCWPWHGQMVDGYGRIKVDGKGRGAHRVLFTLLGGVVPNGHTLDHLCHTLDPLCPGGHCPHRLCCNPFHLEPVTFAENTRRGTRGRQTTCKRGHDLTDPANLKASKSERKQRQCLACIRLLHHERKRAEPV